MAEVKGPFTKSYTLHISQNLFASYKAGKVVVNCVDEDTEIITSSVHLTTASLIKFVAQLNKESCLEHQMTI